MELETGRAESAESTPQSARETLSKGFAFITFDYGIDGVSIEICKYAACLENLLSNGDSACPVHFIGGDFTSKADTVIEPHWHRHHLPGSNGWSKWDGGSWFAKLYYEEMPEGGAASSEMAAEVWRQALDLAASLCGWIEEYEIGLLLPVNVNSNPGNPATALAVVLAIGVE